LWQGKTIEERETGWEKGDGWAEGGGVGRDKKYVWVQVVGMKEKYEGRPMREKQV
jgi:hypothetical protein